MASALYLLNKTIKESKKINLSTYLSLFILILINLYGVHSSILGKLFNVLIVLFIILEQNITFGIIAFCIILLLNNNLQEGFESKTDEASTIPIPVEARFKKDYCLDGKFKDETKNPDNLSTSFPDVIFNFENGNCNPCEETCEFKLTSGKEKLTVEEALWPKPSAPSSS